MTLRSVAIMLLLVAPIKYGPPADGESPAAPAMQHKIIVHGINTEEGGVIDTETAVLLDEAVKTANSTAGVIVIAPSAKTVPAVERGCVPLRVLRRVEPARAYLVHHGIAPNRIRVGDQSASVTPCGSAGVTAPVLRAEAQPN